MNHVSTIEIPVEAASAPRAAKQLAGSLTVSSDQALTLLYRQF
jgi:hypothetical protein